MDQYLNALEENRIRLLEQTKELTADQYNNIPPGFSNNIVWNMGHMLVVGENLLYKNSGFERPVYDLDRINFGKGSKPERFYGEDEIALIRHSLLQTSIFFKKLIPRSEATESLSPGSVHVFNMVDERTLQFLLFHEGMHLRTISWLINAVSK